MSDRPSLDPFDPAQTHAVEHWVPRFQVEAPVARIGDGFVLVTRYEDVRQILKSPDLFANAGGFRPNGLKVPIEDRTLGELDPPEHGPIRKLAIGAASGQGVVERLRGLARRTSAELLGRLLKKGGGDLVGEFSVMLTNRVISAAMSVPPERSDWLAQQGEAIMHSELPVMNRTARGEGYAGAFPEFTGFIDELIRRRRETPMPDGDAIARIIASAEDGAVPADTMVRMVLIQVLLGGTATTRDFIGHLFLELIRQPELHRAVRADRRLVPVAVDEALRLRPPVLFVIRTCRQTTSLRGIEIVPGERVIAAIAAANRDPSVYDEPHRFRLDRKTPAPHLTFGFGTHHCVGSALARMESEVALDEFVERVPPGGLRTVPGYELRHMPTPFLYGPHSVDVETAS